MLGPKATSRREGFALTDGSSGIESLVVGKAGHANRAGSWLAIFSYINTKQKKSKKWGQAIISQSPPLSCIPASKPLPTGLVASPNSTTNWRRHMSITSLRGTFSLQSTTISEGENYKRIRSVKCLTKEKIDVGTHVVKQFIVIKLNPKLKVGGVGIFECEDRGRLSCDRISLCKHSWLFEDLQ